MPATVKVFSQDHLAASTATLDASGLALALQGYSDDERGLLLRLLRQGALLIAVRGADPDSKSEVPQVTALLGALPTSAQATAPGAWYLGFVAHNAKADAVASAPSVWPELWNQLLAKAENLATARGAFSLHAPLNYASWYGYRLRLDHHMATYSWEPKREPLLLQVLLARGYTVAERYLSEAYLSVDDFIKRNAHHRAKLEASQDQILSFGDLQDEAKAPLLQQIWAMCLQEFIANPYFTSIDFADFLGFYVGGSAGAHNHHAAQTATHVDLIIDGNRQLLAFLVSYLTTDELVYKSGAVSAEHRGTGIFKALMSHAARRAQSKGVQQLVLALMHEGNVSTHLAKGLSHLWRHEYAVFSRTLTRQD